MEHPSGDPEVVDISLLGADNQHESGGLFPQNASSEEDTQMATIFPSEKKEKTNKTIELNLMTKSMIFLNVSCTIYLKYKQIL